MGAWPPIKHKNKFCYTSFYSQTPSIFHCPPPPISNFQERGLNIEEAVDFLFSYLFFLKLSVNRASSLVAGVRRRGLRLLPCRVMCRGPSSLDCVGRKWERSEVLSKKGYKEGRESTTQGLQEALVKGKCIFAGRCWKGGDTSRRKEHHLKG